MILMGRFSAIFGPFVVFVARILFEKNIIIQYAIIAIKVEKFDG